jgi:hypothetical protein
MTAPKSAPRVAALRERRAALGLVRLELYVQPEHVRRIRAFAQALAPHKEKTATRPKPSGGE